jgi:hypothetical protein
VANTESFFFNKTMASISDSQNFPTENTPRGDPLPLSLYLIIRALAIACAGGNYWPYVWLARDAARLEGRRSA